MFLVGVHFTPQRSEATVVRIDQRRVYLKKHYHLVGVQRLTRQPGEPDVENTVVRLYGDRDFSTRKRLYSQDRRPARIVRAHPKIVMLAETAGKDIVESLRRKKVPVERVVLHARDAWSRVSPGKGLGDDFHVSRDHLMEVLSRVVKTRRLIVETPDAAAHDPLGILESILSPTPAPVSALAMALALPVWYRETIPYARAYRA